MENGLISSDSHGSSAKTLIRAGCRNKNGGIVSLTSSKCGMKSSFPVERWSVNCEIQGGNVCNCPTAMDKRGYYPQRWKRCRRKSMIRSVGSKLWIVIGSMQKCCSRTDRGNVLLR